MTNEKMKTTAEGAMGPAEYLKMPYGRNVVPEPDGTFRSEIIEFPGCIAVGDTAAEALANLEDVAASWLEATIARGQHVPEPIENIAFSGKLVVRLPKTLHKKAARMAAQEGVSLNQFIVSSVAEQVGHSQARPMLAQLQLGLWSTQRAVWNVPICSKLHFDFWSGKAEPHLFVTLSSGNRATELPAPRRERSHA